MNLQWVLILPQRRNMQNWLKIAALLPLLLLFGCDEGTTGSGVSGPRTLSCVGACEPGGETGIGTVDVVTDWDGTACSMPVNSLYLNNPNGRVFYNTSTPIAGFQFDVGGSVVNGASGGAAGAAGFSISEGNNTVIGFSMELATVSGCGTLVNLALDTYSASSIVTDIVMSDVDGEAIPFQDLR